MDCALNPFRSDMVTEFWAQMTKLCEIAQRPRYEYVDLMSLYHLASYLTVLDVEEQSRRLRIRFSGTQLTTMFGRDNTGRYMDEVDLGEFKQELLAIYDLTITAKKPQWTLASVVIETAGTGGRRETHAFDYERLAVPFQDNLGAITHLVSILVRHKIKTPDKGMEHHQLSFP